MIVNLPHGFAPHIVDAPPRQPRPAVGETRLTGRPVLLIQVDEVTGRSNYVRGYRATSDVLVEGSQRVVHVLDQATWRAAPTTAGRAWPAELVWVE